MKPESLFVLLLTCVAPIAPTVALAYTDQQAIQTVSRANNLFSSQLYNAISQSPNENLVTSPISLFMVLAMLEHGSRANTSELIRSTLNISHSDIQQLPKGCQSILNQLNSPNHVTISMVNQIYSSNNNQLNPDFSRILKTFYFAEPQQLDFSNSQKAARKINSFVSGATNNKIQNLIQASDLDALTKLVLVNAIYFKGLWKNPFPTANTRRADFFASETILLKVDMMRMESRVPYAIIPELDAKAISIPYNGENFSMLILLPNQKTGLPQLKETLKQFSLETIINRLQTRSVSINLPKFKVESTIDLKQPLKKLGLANIFSAPPADFSGILADTSKALYVSKAVQKAFIEVNEQGTEAAAATGFVMRARSGRKPALFHANHPFLALIIANPDSNPFVLFQAHVTHPTLSKE